MDKPKLTMLCDHGGCAGKADADSLDRILNLWQVEVDGRVVLGVRERDDAGTYDLGNGLSLVHSIDVITPVVDEAEGFGRIAVSHALSDIYAKGASPISALSFLGLPVNNAAEQHLEAILSGCSTKLREAGVALLGGHTMFTRELLVGFAVTGTVKSNSLLSLRGARPNDQLVLTKAIGSGIISAAQRLSNLAVPGVSVSEDELFAAIASMALLNDHASRVMIEFDASASTDVSGFGLLGHLSNLVRASSVGVRIHFSAIPTLPGSLRLLSDAIAPARMDENLSHYEDSVTIAKDVDSRWPILYCPETSGGLLIAIGKERARPYVERIKTFGILDCAIIGEVFNDPSSAIVVER